MKVTSRAGELALEGRRLANQHRLMLAFCIAREQRDPKRARHPLVSLRLNR
jgi:hypothetical protein